MTGAGPVLIAAVLDLWIAGGVVAVGVAAALAVGRGLPERVRYLIALAGFLIAALAPLAAVTAAPPVRPVVGGLNASSTPSARSALRQVAELGERGRIADAVAVVWAVGALLLLAREAAGHVLLLSRRRRWMPADIDMRERLDWPARVELCVSDEDGPASVGSFRATVILPRSWMDALPAPAALAVARHELSHARWADPQINALTRLVRAVLWPSLPLWWLERIVRLERETAADAFAVKAAAVEPRTYAAWLLDAAPPRAVPAGVPASGLGWSLERRLRRLCAPRASGRLRIALSLGVLALTAGVAVAAPLASGLRRPIPVLAIPGGATPAYRASAEALNAIVATTAPRDHVVDHAAKARLASIARSGEIAPVLDAATSDDARLRETAVWVAGELGDPRADGVLEDRLRDPDPDVREAAAAVWRRLHKPQ